MLELESVVVCVNLRSKKLNKLPIASSDKTQSLFRGNEKVSAKDAHYVSSTSIDNNFANDVN